MRKFALASLIFAASGSWAQLVTVTSYAYGNAPQIDIHSTQHATLADWAAANYYAESSARADGDSWDPPFTEVATSNSFLQNQAHDAVFRARGLARQPYRGRYNNEVKAISQIQLDYQLEVENLSGSELNIVFGNTIHGVFGVRDLGSFVFQERVTIPGIVTGGEGRVAANAFGLQATGYFTNAVTGTTLQDVLYGQFSDGAYQLNSYQFYGSQQFAPHSFAVFDCNHTFEFFADLGQTDSGLAMFDFSNTGHLTVNAIDPITGADRSSEIRVRLTSVPEPSISLALGLPAMLALRRRKRN